MGKELSILLYRLRTSLHTSVPARGDRRSLARVNTSIQVAGRSSQKRQREKARGSGGGLSVTGGNSSRFDAGRGLQNRSERLEGVNAFSSVPRPAFVSGCIFAPRARSISGNVRLLRKRNKFYREDLRPASMARPIREKQLLEDPGSVQLIA